MIFNGKNWSLLCEWTSYDSNSSELDIIQNYYQMNI